MRRRWKLISSIIGVPVLAGLGAGLAVGLGNHPASHIGTRTGLATSQAEVLEKGIIASTVTAQANIVATEVRGQFEERGKRLLPPGSQVSIDSATFHEISPLLASVNATVSGPGASHWQFVLVRESGHWMLLGSRKLS